MMVASWGMVRWRRAKGSEAVGLIRALSGRGDRWPPSLVNAPMVDLRIAQPLRSDRVGDYSGVFTYAIEEGGLAFAQEVQSDEIEPIHHRARAAALMRETLVIEGICPWQPRSETGPEPTGDLVLRDIQTLLSKRITD
jgi:hypothetical protein